LGDAAGPGQPASGFGRRSEWRQYEKLRGSCGNDEIYGMQIAFIPVRQALLRRSMVPFPTSLCAARDKVESGRRGHQNRAAKVGLLLTIALMMELMDRI
jgi:hypothetical protein